MLVNSQRLKVQELKALIPILLFTQFFASSFEEAEAYVKEPENLLKVLKFNSITSDLVDDSAIFDGVGKVKYQHIEFGKLTMGTYSFANGYSTTSVHTTWKTLNLTQDAVDSLSMDKIENEEAMGDGLVRLVNRYIIRIQAPSVDTYRFTVMNNKVNTFRKALTLTSSNALEQFIHAKARLEDARISTIGLIAYIIPGAKEILKTAAIAKGYFSIGNWSGDLSAEVEMVDGVKLVPTPSSLLPNGVQFILINKDAVPAFEKYSETVLFDTIPGHGKRKLQADIGLYHDCFVYDELTRAVYVSTNTAAAYSLVDTTIYTNGTTSIAGKYLIVDGVYTKQAANAKFTTGDIVYKLKTYTVTYDDGVASSTGTAPTQAATVADGSFTLAANTFTVSGKTFVGWNDGTQLYPAGFNYIMPGNNVTFTAVWE